MRCSWRLYALSATILMWSCGGGDSYSSPTPTSPSPSAPAAPPATSSSAVTVNIVRDAGTNAFVPNPVQVATGGQVMWRNNHTTAHHIVMDDGSGDAGEVAPGGTSRAIALRGASANFHCTLHPTMVGSINGSLSAPPPTDPGPDY